MKLSEHYSRRGVRKGRPHEHEMRPFDRIPPGPDGLSFALFQSTGHALEAGHRAEVINNGKIFDVLEREIRAAQKSVHILLYIWRACGDPSDRILAAVLDRARAGVQCRVVVDPIGSESLTKDDPDFDEHLEPKLREAGVEVHYYRPLRGKAIGRLMGRTHQKIVVIDGDVGITGGFGIWKSWLGDGESEEHWRDTNVRVEGPQVRQMQLAFARAWQESGGDLLPLDAFPVLPPQGPIRAAFVASSGRLGVTDAERMTRMVIGSARKRLWIANAYFSPPSGILHELELKAEQGVDVRVLAPGPVHDVKVMRASQRSTYKRLLKKGIRIWEYQASMLHSKTLLVDDWLTVIGSTNMDPLSLNKLGEGSLVMEDKEIAAGLERDFLRDCERSKEMRFPKNAHSGPFKRLSRRLTVWAGMDR